MATDIAAFILQANGSVPGAQRLAPATTARIGEIGMRQTPPALATAQTPAPATAPAAPRRPRLECDRHSPTQPLGLTLTGEVPNYVPVTDEMLQEPAAGRLADGAAELPGLELQPADPDHARQREGPASSPGSGR